MTEKILREFAEWVKTEPIYVGGGIADREILVIRNGKFESAIEVYLKEKEQEEFYSNGYRQGYEDAKKQFESPIVQVSMKDLTAEEKQHFFNVWKNVPLQVIEERHGRWIKTQEDRWIYPICSECGYKENVVTNYCANCGAKMDKEGK